MGNKQKKLILNVNDGKGTDTITSEYGTTTVPYRPTLNDRMAWDKFKAMKQDWDEWNSVCLDEVLEFIKSNNLDVYGRDGLIEQVQDSDIDWDEIYEPAEVLESYDDADLIKEVQSRDTISLLDIWSDEGIIRDMLEPINRTLVQLHWGNIEE